MRRGRLNKMIKTLRRDINKLLKDAKQVKSAFKPEINASIGETYGPVQVQEVAKIEELRESVENKFLE